MDSSYPPLKVSSPELELKHWWKWCLPAIILGFALRLLLLSEWPKAFFWPDSKDAVFTAKRWIEDFGLSIHYKKSWIPPVAYAFGAQLPGGLLNWMAWIQHALGLLSLLFVGGLCRVWFAQWRWFIIPVTCLVAINPSIIIWEHALMQEPWFMPAVLFFAWQLGYLVHEPTKKRFFWLAASVFLCASTRPEGKLFMVVLPLAWCFIFWKARSILKPALIAILITCVLIKVTSKRGQSGLLLMTSVVPLLAETVSDDPNLTEPLLQIRDQLAAGGTFKARIPNAKTRKQVSDTIKSYLNSKNGKSPSDEDINRLCKRLAARTTFTQAHRVPQWLWLKFRRVSHEIPTCSWETQYVIDDQIEGLSRDLDLVRVMGKKLFGANPPSTETTSDWIKHHYNDPGKAHWMTQFCRWWEKKLLGWRTPVEGVGVDDLDHVPFIKYLGFAGMATALLGRTRYHQIQWLMVPTLLTILAAVLLSANIKPRFLFFIEPFWLIYPFLAVDLWIWQIRGWITKRST